MSYEDFLIIKFIKSANLKGKIEISGDGITGPTTLIWDLGGLFLYFCLGDLETTVLYSKHKGGHSALGHFHEDTCNVINLIEEVNREDKRVHITTAFWGSSFRLEDKIKAKKKNGLFVRHYYSEL